jgi:hypothetical protein
MVEAPTAEAVLDAFARSEPREMVDGVCADIVSFLRTHHTDAERERAFAALETE